MKPRAPVMSTRIEEDFPGTEDPRSVASPAAAPRFAAMRQPRLEGRN
jgi:hypothetical protein